MDGTNKTVAAGTQFKDLFDAGDQSASLFASLNGTMTATNATTALSANNEVLTALHVSATVTSSVTNSTTNGTDSTSTITAALKTTPTYLEIGKAGTVEITVTSSAAANAANGIDFTSDVGTTSGSIANGQTTGTVTVTLAAGDVTSSGVAITLTAVDPT